MVRRDHPSNRLRLFETLEARLVLASSLSASATEPYWDSAGWSTGMVPAASTYQPADLASLRAQFGLTGRGQTVAVIDSGIAYDHVALGGGFGPGYRVVGGWDFAENDDDPYDDAPAGFHGTHVAGILAADDPRWGGVAPGVDLVALRVFDDRGRSSLEWVRQALDWVHAHRHAFVFPITTVNLSLGATFNGDAPPAWGSLEASLKRLVDDGIVITVAAGNLFQVYAAPGLAYPAASPYVVPVASVGPDGTLSRFSQRDTRVLAAPGEQIVSALPDAFYGSDGVKNDWGAASGTSMAAPHVAGAAVLLRQAMQQLDMPAATPDAVIQWLTRTADTLLDPQTALTYHRLNLPRALQALVGVDEYGSTPQTAHPLGPLHTEVQLTGILQSASDRDYFQFTAAASGEVELRLTAPPAVGAAWILPDGRLEAGNILTLPVEAGQRYIVGVTSAAQTIGRYTLTLTPARPLDPPPVDLGILTQWVEPQVPLSGGRAALQFVAGRTGRLTVELWPATGQAIVATLRVDNAQRQPVGSLHGSMSPAPVGSTAVQSRPPLRLDLEVVAGQRYVVQVESPASRVGLRLTNLVCLRDGKLWAAGTDREDLFEWQGGPAGWLAINGTRYDLSGITQVSLDASAGHDRLILHGGPEAETFLLGPQRVEVHSRSLVLVAAGMGRVTAQAQPEDEVQLHDSPGSDLLLARPQGVQLVTPQQLLEAEGAGLYRAFSQAGGRDTARLIDSSGDDRLWAGPGWATLAGGGATLDVQGFSQIVVTAIGGGNDRAVLQRSSDQDRFETSRQYVALRGTGYGLRLSGLAEVQLVRDGQRVARSPQGGAGAGRAATEDPAWEIAGGVEMQANGFELVAGLERTVPGRQDPLPPPKPSHAASHPATHELTFIGCPVLLHGLEPLLVRVHAGKSLATDLEAVDRIFQTLGENDEHP